MTMNEILLRNITGFIKMYGMTESECLGKCGVHSNFISNLRNGKLKNPSLESVYSMAKFFGISIDKLICYVPSEEDPDIHYNERRNSRIMCNAYLQLDTRGKEAVREVMLREKCRMENE